MDALRRKLSGFLGRAFWQKKQDHGDDETARAELRASFGAAFMVQLGFPQESVWMMGWW